MVTNAQVTDSPAAAPYPPSWFDRFTDAVDRLRIPPLGFYAGFALLLISLQIAIQWAGRGALAPFPLVLVFTLAYDLALMHHLDGVAEQALARFRPTLTISDTEYAELRYRLTTLPALPALFFTVVGALYGVLMLRLIPFDILIDDLGFANTPPSVHFNNAITLPICAVIILLLYHTAHQLRVVQQVYQRCVTVDLYALHPLYAFSTLSAQTAVGIVFIAYAWAVFAPAMFSLPVSLLGLLAITGVALFTFIYPLLGAHRLLAEEKHARLANNGALQRATLTELHRRVDDQNLADMDGLNKALSSLELERNSLNRISTWPWQPETLRAVMAALFFPIMVWLTQWVLQRLLTL